MCYAVAKGRETGIFTSWASVEYLVKGYSGAIFKKFRTRAQAQEFLTSHLSAEQSIQKGEEAPAPTLSGTSDVSGHINVWTDGACSNNQYADIREAGYGVFFGPGDSRNISGKLLGSNQTNNRAELTAVLVALRVTQGPVLIHTDSRYVMDPIVSGGLARWQQNNWRHILNSDLWLEYIALANGRQISFRHVNGHSGDVGNDGADVLARAGIFKS